MTDTLHCDDLDTAIERYTNELGYRLDMIFPADSPREALVSKNGETVRLCRSSRFQVPSAKFKAQSLGRDLTLNLEPGTLNSDPASKSDWIAGRAGMMYRDLIPERVNGKVIASHIRLLEDGPVADYVHYHKVEFQMIYCLKGRIEVVYEDQGPPFWLEAGDCVVQPPEIRHRVLFSEGNAEVLEVTMPAEHETWREHDITLPNETVDKARLFNDQPFVLTKNTQK